jgi:hypothetical protein
VWKRCCGDRNDVAFSCHVELALGNFTMELVFELALNVQAILGLDVTIQ